MTDKAEKLILDFKAKGWQTPNLYERFFDLATKSDDIFSFSKQYLTRFDEGATIFDDSLSYIGKDQFAELIVLALDILKSRQNEGAKEVIHYASLQFPELLHDHLTLIFELKPDERTYYADYPWRNLSADKIEIFKDKLLNPKTALPDKQKLFRCLLETRDFETIKFVAQFAKDTKLFDGEDLEDYIVAHLELVGYTKRNGKIERYCSSTTRHLSFPDKYFLDDHAIHLSKNQHPTWNLTPADPKFNFGGILQASETNPFIHIITLDSIPKDIGVTGIPKLTLGLHIRELNEFGILFYQHDNLGDPKRIGELNEVKLYNDYPIKETQIAFAETPKRWEIQSWGSSNSRENLFRLGGEPTWIQGAEVLTCPICNEKMNFLMQLDTDLPDIENGELCFGSGGICYIFWCDKTKVSGYVMQCT